MDIDGKKLALKVRSNLKKIIEDKKLKPKLVIILVGNNDASEIYVRNKIKAGEEIGIEVIVERFSADNKEEEIIFAIKKYNDDKTVNGIIVQSPLPDKFREDYIISFINKDKDVDGFGVANLGELLAGKENILAATPKGIIRMLEEENIDVKGKHVVIVGRSRIVGRPLALALLNRDATVTITHSKTKDLDKITKLADILVVAMGKANFITKEYIKPGAVVIDVGINRTSNGLCGDVNYKDVKDIVSYITPVPGGVGPMTVAELLENVVLNAIKERKE